MKPHAWTSPLETASASSPLETASAFLVGGGILTMALFPLALPIIGLLAVAAVPLLLLAMAAGFVAAAVAAPVLLVRALWRRLVAMQSRGRVKEPTPRDADAAHFGAAAAPRAADEVGVAPSGVTGR
jgi:hypothetical protein